MACSTCTGIRRAVNSAVLRPLGLRTLPVPPVSQVGVIKPQAQPANPAWPTRKP
jgi:hypothetical protein